MSHTHQFQVAVSGSANDAGRIAAILGQKPGGCVDCEQREVPGGFRLDFRTKTPKNGLLAALRAEFTRPGYMVEEYQEPVANAHGVKTPLIVVAPLI